MTPVFITTAVNYLTQNGFALADKSWTVPSSGEILFYLHYPSDVFLSADDPQLASDYQAWLVSSGTFATQTAQNAPASSVSSPTVSPLLQSIENMFSKAGQIFSTSNPSSSTSGDTAAINPNAINVAIFGGAALVAWWIFRKK